MTYEEFTADQAKLEDTLRDIGERSWPTLGEARAALAHCGLKLGRKTGSRTWTIVAAGVGAFYDAG